MQNLLQTSNFKTNADLEDHVGGSKEKVAAKKERLRLKVDWEWLYEKDTECKNWNYKICSYYLWKAEKQTKEEIYFKRTI